MILFDYGLIHIAAKLCVSLDSFTEPVHYLVGIVKKILSLGRVTCPYLRTACITCTCFYRKFALDIVSCVFGIVVMSNAAKASIINYLAFNLDNITSVARVFLIAYNVRSFRQTITLKLLPSIVTVTIFMSFLCGNFYTHSTLPLNRNF